MGLLTRARSVETGTGRPRGSEASLTSDKGLLARSRQYLGSTLYPARVPQAEVEGARSRSRGGPQPLSEKDLHSALLRIPDGVDAPGLLFAVLRHQLSLTRAALLLLDPGRSVFAPWASQGFDETTLHRLRVPTDAGGHLQRLEAGEILVLEDPAERAEWRRYFSTREHATMERLLLVPFVYQGRLLAVLLASRAERPFDEALLAVLRSSLAPMAALLYRSREQRLEGLPQAQRAEDMRERVAVAARAAAARGNRLALIRFSLGPLVARLRERNPFADAFRLQDDLNRLVLSLFRPLGSVLQPEAHKILLVAGVSLEPDLPLLTAHLRTALQTFLPQLAEGPAVDLEEAMRLCAPSSEEAATCLAELI